MRAPALALLAVLVAGCSSLPSPEPPPMPSPIPVFPGPPGAARSAPPVDEAPPADPKLAGVTIQVHKVAGNVYMLEGAGGNIAVSVGEDGIVIVDDQFAPLAPRIKAALKGLGDRPLRVVLNTHWHGDHTGGNAVFGRTATIVAHENVRKRLVTGSPKIDLGGGKSKDARPPAPREALPIITFQDRVSIHLNGEEIRALHLPSGHTDGDVIVHFTRSNVVHMGDDFVTYGFPYVDLASGGSVRGIIAAMDRAVKELPADVKVIPGHGTISTLEDVKKLSATLKDCVKLVEAEVKKKKKLADVQAAKPLARYDAMGKAFVGTDAFVETIFKELTAPKPAPTKAR